MIYENKEVTYQYFLTNITEINKSNLKIILENQSGYEKERFANFCKFYLNIELDFEKQSPLYSNDSVFKFFQNYFKENFSSILEKFNLIEISYLLNESNSRKLTIPEMKKIFISLNDLSRETGLISLESIILNDFQTMDKIIELTLIYATNGILIKKSLNRVYSKDIYYSKLIKGMKAIQYGLPSEYLERLYS